MAGDFLGINGRAIMGIGTIVCSFTLGELLHDIYNVQLLLSNLGNGTE